MLWVFDKDQATGRPIPVANPAWPVKADEFPGFTTVYSPRGLVLWNSGSYVCIQMADINLYIKSSPIQSGQ